MFAVDRKNGRCGATNVNPTTGRGDPVFVPRATPGPAVAYSAAAQLNGSQRRFMCRGCYFIYEEANGLPQQSIRPGTAFADIPANWRCPDCGTEKATFRPYVEKAAAS